MPSLYSLVCARHSEMTPIVWDSCLSTCGPWTAMRLFAKRSCHMHHILQLFLKPTLKNLKTLTRSMLWAGHTGRKSLAVDWLILGKVRISWGAVLNLLVGSYYANPIHGAAITSDSLKVEFPEYTEPNIWPSPAVLPGFKEAFENLGRLIVDVGALLAKVISSCYCCWHSIRLVTHTVVKFVARLTSTAAVNIEGYPPGYIESVVRRSSTTKARLLHYFPPEDDQMETKEEVPLDSWCGRPHKLT